MTVRNSMQVDLDPYRYRGSAIDRMGGLSALISVKNESSGGSASGRYPRGRRI
jgi:hypothetical protein